MKGFDIIVTGGRDYDDLKKVKEVLGLFQIYRIIEGGAKGADCLARLYAQENSIEVLTVRADWDKHGKAAGPIRNREMLEAHPDAVVLAFPGGRGTENCIDTALKLGMTVLRIEE